MQGPAVADRTRPGSCRQVRGWFLRPEQLPQNLFKPSTLHSIVDSGTDLIRDLETQAAVALSRYWQITESLRTVTASTTPVSGT